MISAVAFGALLALGADGGAGALRTLSVLRGLVLLLLVG